jgi:hypothetical protein
VIRKPRKKDYNNEQYRTITRSSRVKRNQDPASKDTRSDRGGSTTTMTQLKETLLTLFLIGMLIGDGVKNIIRKERV